jgi:exopolysaccharide biosynthesis polyprenyl glycosylphosphotransferase
MPDRDVRHAGDESVFRMWNEVRRRTVRIGILLLSDTVAGLLGVQVALMSWALVSNHGLRPVPRIVPLLAMVFCIQPLALAAAGAYGRGRRAKSLARIGLGLLITAVAGWIQARLFGHMTPDLPNKTAYLYSAVWIGTFLWPFRELIQSVVRMGYRKGTLQRRAVVVGVQAEIDDLHTRIASRSNSDLAVVATLTSEQALSSPTAIRDAVQNNKAHLVLLTPSIPFDAFRTMILHCFSCGAGVSLMPRTLSSLGASHFELRDSYAGTLLQVFPMTLGIPQLAAKRAMDVVLTLLALSLIWPLLAALALAVKLDAGSPVLFRQERMGLGGRRFHILKFRTMVLDADQHKASLQHLNEYPDGRLFKIKSDPRVTRLGRILRKLSLDELPQLWNVLKGDMSLVGPRPCVPEEFALYAPHHMERLFVVPGLTGPWQVQGRNSVTDFEQVVRLDREYIQSWSLLSDLLILIKTVPTLLGHGAY